TALPNGAPRIVPAGARLQYLLAAATAAARSAMLRSGPFTTWVTRSGAAAPPRDRSHSVSLSYSGRIKDGKFFGEVPVKKRIRCGAESPPPVCQNASDGTLRHPTRRNARSIQNAAAAEAASEPPCAGSGNLSPSDGRPTGVARRIRTAS